LLRTRFDEALQLLTALHRQQTRKGNEVPYLAHLMGHGGEEDTAIAALLHDAVEDQGGATTAELIRKRFGGRLAELVLHFSDSITPDAAAKAPWRERKTAYLAKADAAVALISAAEKLHNVSATLRDVRRYGAATLERFAEPHQLVWCYGAVADALARDHDLALVNRRKLIAIAAEAAAAAPRECGPLADERPRAEASKARKYDPPLSPTARLSASLSGRPPPRKCPPGFSRDFPDRRKYPWTPKNKRKNGSGIFRRRLVRGVAEVSRGHAPLTPGDMPVAPAKDQRNDPIPLGRNDII
jgi:hypothetical protein